MLITIWNEIKSKYYCYLHKRKDGRIFYVGKGTYERAIDLCPSTRNTWHANIVAKEGRENIIIELIPANDEAHALYLEEFVYIPFLKPYFKLCNLTDGGEGCSGYRHTDEAKEKMSINHPDQTGERGPMYGKHHTKEAKKKMSKFGEKNPMYGKHHTEEAKNKNSINQPDHTGKNNPMYGKIGELSPNYGKPRSEETKLKISLTIKATHENKKNTV